jgi:hypothetical protein
MSVTFYVDGWNEQPSNEVKVYAHEEHPTLDEEYFSSDPFYKKDQNGYYEIKKVYSNPFPDVNFSNSNSALLLRALGYESIEYGEFPIEQLSDVISRGMALINNDRKVESNVRKTEVFQRTSNVQHLDPEIEQNKIQGQFIYMGADADYIKRSINSLLTIVKFAQSKNKSIYWG